VYCFASLHNEPAEDPDKGYLRYLLHLQKKIPPSEARQFADLLKTRTPPAIFKAYYDLYLNSVSMEAVNCFAHLVQIGRNQEGRLGTPFLEWAEAQSKHMIRSQVHVIRMWVQDVCHRRVYDPNEDAEEEVFWRRWPAPSLIIMSPSRYRPYDADKAWELNDPETSAKWLKAFEDDYVLRLELKIRKLAGEAAVALAKESKPAQPAAAQPNGPVEKQETSGATDPAPKTYSPSKSVRREAGKLETRAKYAGWQKAYRKLAKQSPGKTDGWYSQKICQMEVAKGGSAETIRKHMKK
jgi:hypothetical protein